MESWLALLVASDGLLIVGLLVLQDTDVRGFVTYGVLLGALALSTIALLRARDST